MPEGKLLGRVLLTCPNKEEILELPGGSPVVELLTKAAALFGCGHFHDRAHRRASKYHDLARGFYTWSPAERGAALAHGPAHYTEMNLDGWNCYDELVWLAGYEGWIPFKCITVGDPEILWIYPKQHEVATIDRLELGDWGTKRNPVPIKALGWWKMIKESVALPLRSQGLEAGLERSTAVNMH